MDIIQIETDTLLNKMNKVDFFKKLDTEDQKNLLKIAETIEFKEKEVIIKERDNDTYFYVLLNGRANIMVESDQQIFIDNISAVCVFGESAIFSNVKRTASVIADESVQLLRFEKDSFLKYVREESEAGITILMSIIETLLRKLRVVNQDLAVTREALMEKQDYDPMWDQVFSNLSVL